MDGPRAFATATPFHFPWTHTNSRRGACQSASSLPGRGTSACLGPSRDLSFSLLCAPPSTCMEAEQWNYQCVLSKAVWMPHPRHGELYLLIRVLWVRALLQLQYSASPRGGTVALQFSPPFFLFLRAAKNERQDSQWIKHKPEYIQAAHLIPLIPIKDMCFWMKL